MKTTTVTRPWSKSQSAAFRECQRKYFFNTTSLLGSENDSAFVDRNQVQSLKKLKNRFLWGGSLVHQIIGDILKTVRQGQTVGEADMWIQRIKDRMRTEFLSSKMDQGSPNRLFEHEYSSSVSGEVWQNQWKQVE